MIENYSLNNTNIIIYNKKLIEFSKTADISKVSELLFASVGGFITMTQLTEFVLHSMNYILKTLSEKGSSIEEKLKELDERYLISQVERTIKFKKTKQTLGEVLFESKDTNLINEYFFNILIGINIERNYFAHHYLADNPNMFSDIGVMKNLSLRVFREFLLIGQVLIDIYTQFLNNMIEEYPECGKTLKKLEFLVSNK